MQIKLLLYFIVLPIIMYILPSINLERFFRQGHINQIKAFYIIISFSLSYLVVNFLYDFYLVTKFY